MRLSLHLLFFHRVRTLRNKNYKDNFFSDENENVFNFNSPELGLLKLKWVENLTLSTVWDADVNGQKAQTKKKLLNIFFIVK